MTEINNLDVEMGEVAKDHSLLLGMAEIWFKHKEACSLNLFYLNMLISDNHENPEPLTMSNYASYVMSCEFPNGDGYIYEPLCFGAVASCNERDYGKFPAVSDNYQRAVSLIKLNYIDVIGDNKSDVINNIALTLASDKADEDEIDRLVDLVSACIVYLDIDLNFNIETVREEITNDALTWKMIKSSSKNKDESLPK